MRCPIRSRHESYFTEGNDLSSNIEGISLGVARTRPKHLPSFTQCCTPPLTAVAGYRKIHKSLAVGAGEPGTTRPHKATVFGDAARDYENIKNLL